MGEHLPCKQGVKGSNPFISTVPVFRNKHLENCISKIEDIEKISRRINFIEQILNEKDNA